MRPDQLVLRCLAERDRPDSWFAICIDLNVYARGASLRDARKQLHAEINQYLLEAFTVDKDHFLDLIPRPAPLIFRLKYGLCKLLRRHTGKPDGSSRAMPFRERMPLTLAPC